MIRRTLVVTLGLALAAGAGAAQEPEPPGAAPRHGGMMGMQGMRMGPGMMDMAMGGPGMILQLREPLGLTEAQVRRVEAIQARTEEARTQHLHAAMQAHHQAMEVLAAESPDLSTYETRLREAADHWVLAQVASARGLEEARSVLTPEQRANTRFAMRAMHAMMREHMQGMMRGDRPANDHHDPDR